MTVSPLDESISRESGTPKPVPYRDASNASSLNSLVALGKKGEWAIAYMHAHGHAVYFVVKLWDRILSIT